MIDQSVTVAQFEEVSRVFNEGCDARLSGVPLRECPYSNGWERYWRDGWHDVDCCYGMFVRGRWLVKPLVRILADGRC